MLQRHAFYLWFSLEFLFYFISVFIYIFEFHSFKQTLENPLKVSKLQPGVVLIGTNFFLFHLCFVVFLFSKRSVSEMCTDVRACAHVYIKTNIDSQKQCVCVRASVCVKFYKCMYM